MSDFARTERALYRTYLMAEREFRKTGGIDDEIDAMVARREWASLGDDAPVRGEDGRMVAA